MQTMKTVLHNRIRVGLSVAVLCGGVAVSASGVQPGDSREAVIREMGQPAGLLRAQDREWLSWPRGRVELKDGLVVAIDLLTPRELDAKLQREAAEAAAAQQAARERKQKQDEEGRQVFARLLSSETVREASPARQVALWEDFMRNYPGVDATEPYLAALSRLDKELARARDQEEMERLRAEAQAATWRALDAEREAQRARAVRYYTYSPYDWNWRDYRRRSYDFGYDSPDISVRSPHGRSGYFVYPEGRERLSRVAEVPMEPPVVQDKTYRVPTSPMQYDFRSPTFP